MAESCFSVSMGGDDEIISMLGHTLQGLLEVRDPTGEVGETSGI